MRSRGAKCTAIASILCLTAIADAAAQEPLQAAPLRTFDATQLTPDRYTVIGRIWVESPLTAFDVSRHEESSAAIAELSAQAVTLGADAITHVTCLNDRSGWLERGYFCHALAIKLR
jgi:uncharacterized protein YbjQ (UPF0145 family)